MQSDKDKVISAVLDMVRKQQIQVQQPAPIHVESNGVNAFELTSIVLLALKLSENAAMLSWWIVPIPFLIPYAVMMGAISINKIKEIFKKKK